MRARVLIIGGGLAGLTAAHRLSGHGYATMVVDRHAQLGGGFRPIDSAPSPPVLLFGWQQGITSLLQDLQTEPFIQRLGYSQILLWPSAQTARVRWGAISGALTAIWRVSTLSALPLRDRWHLLEFLDRLRAGEDALPLDLETRCAEAWVAELGQSRRARARFWEPICQLLVGEGLGSVSAAALAQLLQRCFCVSRAASRLSTLSGGVETAILAPLCRALWQQDVTVRANTSARRLCFDANGVSGVQIDDGTVLAADRYILAIPHQELLGLLPERMLSRYSCFSQLIHLQDSPRVTVHLLLADRLAAPRLILTTGPFPWLLVQSPPEGEFFKEAGSLISLVTKGSVAANTEPDHELLDSALRTVRDAIGFRRDTRQPPIASWIGRQTHGALSAKPGAATLRPLQTTPIPNLFIAGGWTHTGQPAGLDGAITSGELCAHAILRHVSSPDHALTSPMRPPKIPTS